MTTLADMTDAERSRFEQRDRATALDAAAAAGRLGLPRPPDEALFAGGLDPSDTAVIQILDAYLAGQLERRK